MKKIAILALAVLFCPLAMANNSAAPVATPAQRQQAEVIIVELVSAMEEVVTLLEGINSKETADAAADRLPVLVAKANAIVRKGKGMGNFRFKVEAKLERIMEEHEARTLLAVQNLVSNQFYGSYKLIYVTQNLKNL